jgi:hypothetical protein
MIPSLAAPTSAGLPIRNRDQGRMVAIEDRLTTICP